MILPSSMSLRKTVWLNGSFDVLHSGHVKLFRYARMLAGPNGLVVVGTDTDERISSYKGPSRPINSLEDRIFVLSSIRYVDQVVSFSSNAELEAHISAITPDYMLIGDDYRGREIVGSQYIKKIIYITRDDKSTSNIVNR